MNGGEYVCVCVIRCTSCDGCAVCWRPQVKPAHWDGNGYRGCISASASVQVWLAYQCGDVSHFSLCRAVVSVHGPG